MARFVLRYAQGSGRLFLCNGSDNCLLLARGYSGDVSHRDRTRYENLPGQGPIPRGAWKVGVPHNHPRLGPEAIPLTPYGHDALGRSEFFMHGDNAKRNFTASRGCIIVPRYARVTIGNLVRHGELDVLHVEAERPFL